MPNAIKKRLKLHQDWTNDIPLNNIWAIRFSAESGKMANVGNAIKHYLDIYRPHSFEVDPHLIDNVSDNAAEVGFMLAQAVAFPNESFNIETIGIAKGGGGIQPAQIGGSRSSENNVSITFLETNRDVFSFFIQPWIVAASYTGLIEDATEPGIKCIIEVIQYSRSKDNYLDKPEGSSSSGVEYTVRKIHTFYDAVPTNLEGGAISYGALSESDITRAVAFNFSYYEVKTL